MQLRHRACRRLAAVLVVLAGCSDQGAAFDTGVLAPSVRRVENHSALIAYRGYTKGAPYRGSWSIRAFTSGAKYCVQLTVELGLSARPSEEAPTFTSCGTVEDTQRDRAYLRTQEFLGSTYVFGVTVARVATVRASVSGGEPGTIDTVEVHGMPVRFFGARSLRSEATISSVLGLAADGTTVGTGVVAEEGRPPLDGRKITSNL